MFGRSWRMSAWLVAAAVVALAAAPVYAASPTQQGTSGLYNWYTLAPGKQAEWIFQYLGDNERAAVVLGENPASAIVMNVYNDEQWRALGAGDNTIEPVGKGTTGTLNKWEGNKDVRNAGSLFWEARAKPPVRFHVQVINTSQQPAQYWIAQIGTAAGGLSAVSPLAPVATAQAQPTAVAQAQQGAGAATQAAVSGAAATPVPVPHTLPVSGGAELSWLLAAGSALAAAGWVFRRHAR